jgi:hypothetical protein
MSQIFTPPQLRILRTACELQKNSVSRVYGNLINKKPELQEKIRKLGKDIEIHHSKWTNAITDLAYEFEKLAEDPDYILELPSVEFEQLVFTIDILGRYYIDSTPKAYHNLKNKLLKIKAQIK